MTKAEELFDASAKYENLLGSVIEDISEILTGSRDPECWPFEDITHDYYDASFELKQAADDLGITDHQSKEFSAMGFAQCWICHRNGTETHVSFLAGKT